MPALADIIAAEADIAAAFVSLLQEEQEILKAGNPDALPAIAERKAEAVRKLAPLAAARNGELARSGFSADRNGIENWLTRTGSSQTARQAWERLQALAAEAKELNRLNGELIQMRMQNNSQALEVLLAAGRQDLYGADGQASPSTARRIIDSA